MVSAFGLKVWELCNNFVGEGMIVNVKGRIYKGQ